MPTYRNIYDSKDGGASATVTLEQGQTALLVLSTASGSTPSIQCYIERKVASGRWQRVPDERGAPGTLGAGLSELPIGVPGEYRVQVPSTQAAVQIDEVR